MRDTAISDGMLLLTENLRKSYGDLVAVDDVTWGVERGETKAVIGPNGAGKTTFFNLLSGVLDPTSGSIRFGGNDITDLSLHEVVQQGVVKTYQITNIFEELTVFQNVQVAVQRTADVRETYAIHTSSSSLSAVNRRADELLERLRMADVADVEAANLSHGDQRKLEIGIGLATDPAVLLLDEPTAGMSSEETSEVVDFLEEVTASDITVVITEHDIDVILELADVITVLHNGQVLAEGTADEITANEEVQEVYFGT